MTCSSMCGFRRLLDVGRVVFILLLMSLCARLDPKSSCGVFRMVRRAKKGFSPVEWAVQRIFLACLMAASTLPFNWWWWWGVRVWMKPYLFHSSELKWGPLSETISSGNAVPCQVSFQLPNDILWCCGGEAVYLKEVWEIVDCDQVLLLLELKKVSGNLGPWSVGNFVAD